jgi:hypothetical protein
MDEGHVIGLVAAVKDFDMETDEVGFKRAAMRYCLDNGIRVAKRNA